MDTEIASATDAHGVGRDFWSQGLDRGFFSRMYVRATQIGIGATILFAAFEQKQVAWGILSGLIVGLFSVWTVEAATRLLFGGGGHAGLKLAIAAMLKMPLMLGGLLGIAWACYHHHMNVFGVLGGVLIVHGTMLVSVVATAMAHEDRSRERYR